MWRGTQPVVQYINVYLLALYIKAPFNNILDINIQSNGILEMWKRGC